MRQENRDLLGPHDVIMASHPGSGTSWISTLLVHLGVFYAAGEEELLAEPPVQAIVGRFEDVARRPPALGARGTEPRTPTIGAAEQQRHLAAVHQRAELNPEYREPLRVVHTGQAPIGWAPSNKVVLLVRDGRDAVLSLYHNLASFSGLDVSLLEYLEGHSGAWPLPAMSWGFACMSWLGSTPPDRLHVLRFETCREQPLDEFRALLAFLGVERSEVEIEQAIHASSYSSMRKQETALIEAHGHEIGRSRVMRKGQVGGWRDTYTDEMLKTFKGLPQRALKQFGYS